MNDQDIKNLSTDAVNLAGTCAARYVDSIRDKRVFPTQSDLDALRNFDEALPQNGTAAIDVLQQLDLYGANATVATTGGRYFGLVVGGATPASMGASIMNAAWDQIAIMENTAPTAIHLERLAAQWIVDLLHLPNDGSVGFTTGSSVANLVGLAAARNALYENLGINIEECGLTNAPPLQVVLSEQAHVTVHKALKLLGFGTNQMIKVPCDSQGRIKPNALPEIGPDTIVCLQAGNVNSGAFDPFAEIIPEAKQKGAWVHIDGAFGLWALASPDKKHLAESAWLADSWAVDAHKWLNTPYDCGITICRNPKAVHEVMTTVAPYLTSSENVPPKDMVPEFSRRARGVEVWAAIKEMGQEGISDLINRCCNHAITLANGLQELGYEIVNDVVLNQVVATIGNPDDIKAIAKFVQDEGECWFGTTVWQGRTAIRLSVSSWATTDNDVKRTLESIKRATESVLK
ncbi:pyridoxal phosphate-dependent decarboxylase family protein [Neptuniibacter sp. SY11_33]|uniref:pyridoxal phosphate-dependent decarboxylase family protein n=1 Tax=Neptuniibacter sp. SY11_33 TaxID=3398215 RepID=UPI0039F4D2AC